VTRVELRRGEVNLSALAHKIAEKLCSAHPERKVDLVIQDELVAEADPALIHLVIKNLIGNAWKFTSKLSRARIEFGSARDIYFVRDNGAGFDMTYVKKLFGAFQRLHSPAEFPGTGIGLATVQRIIHRHGGRVWAEGAVNQGATFYFTL
jgi:light-regulated signal transduction histidine kinase (bacteriophytochrome)